MFRYSPADLAEMTIQVNELLQAGLIQKSTSPIVAPVLFVSPAEGVRARAFGVNAVAVVRFPAVRDFSEHPTLKMNNVGLNHC
jgi:hypothetical protein